MTSPLRSGTLTVAELVARKLEPLRLEVLTPELSLERDVADPDISSPGLALAGFTARFTSGRIQVFGETEMTFLATLSEVELRERLGTLFTFDIPVVFVTKGLEVPATMLDLATKAGIPVVRSAVSTKVFYQRVKPFIEINLAPYTHLHGSLADVYGVGLLFVGKSGIGKSECVLDLVERGHRLVADDLVIATRTGNDVLMGRGHERQRHHMEIRGVGIIDIAALFGVRAIRQQKRIEVVVQLEHWDGEQNYTRTGLDDDLIDMLGVKLPRVTIPLHPGKNITVIAEVVAMNHLLRYAGVNSAAAFDQQLRDAMAPVRDYLEQDYE